MVRKLIVALSFAAACSAQAPTYNPGKTKLTVVDVRNYSGATLCDQINAAAAANPNTIIDARGMAGGTYNCGAVNITNAKIEILFNGQTILTTSVGFNLDNREVLGGWIANLGSTAPTSGFKLAADSTFPIGTGALSVSGTQGPGGTTLTIAKAASTSITIMPFDVIQIGTAGAGDTTLYYVTPACATVGCGQAGYPLAGGGTVTLNITPALAQSEVNGTAITLGHPVVEFGALLTNVGDSPSGVGLFSAFVSCSSSPSGITIGLRDNFAQENSRARDAYVSDCPRGYQIVGHSANSGPWENLNVGYPNGNCATGPDNGRAGTTLPMEVSGAHKQISRVTITTSPCVNAPAIFVVDSPQGGGISASGGTLLSDLHGEGVTSPLAPIDMILITGASTGPVFLSNISGCPLNNPCTNIVHVNSNVVGTVLVDDVVQNAGTTNFVKDDVASNTITVASNANGIANYTIDGHGASSTNANCIDMTNGFCNYNGVFSVYSGGQPAKFSVNSPGLVSAYSGIATAAQGIDAIQASVSNTGNTSADGSPVNLQCGGAVCPAGFYTVRACLLVTTTGLGGTIKIQIGWTDTLGATTQAIVTSPTVTSTSRTCSTLPLQSTGSVNITKQVLFTGVTGSPAYAQYITLERQQ